MKVRELIAALQKMPQDADVLHLWDGDARTEINLVWLSRGQQVITADYDEACYPTDVRPEDAPTEEQEPYWQTPSDPLVKHHGEDDAPSTPEVASGDSRIG